MFGTDGKLQFPVRVETRPALGRLRGDGFTSQARKAQGLSALGAEPGARHLHIA